MNRDAKTQSALIALARTRRTQRALAHAYLHRGAPIPSLRSSVGYMTSTACVTEDAAAIGHRMTVLGISIAEGVAYVVEELGDDNAPVVYRLYLRGARQGHLVPIHAWYASEQVPLGREHAESTAQIRARITKLLQTLEPVRRTTTEAWMLSTRIVQRRALRVASGACSDLPIRKFALQLVVEPVSGHGSSGKTTVTAFLRPGAELAEVWALPGNVAIARVTYIGIPSGIGLTKDTVVLLTGIDYQDSHD